MSADDITPASLLIGFAVLMLAVVAAWTVHAWWARRRDRRQVPGEGPVIDLTYLEQAIRADADAARRRNDEDKPLLSRASGRSADPGRRLPTDDR